MEARSDTNDIVDDFVGRAEELAILQADLAALPSPAGPIRLLTGPAGVGKTRLAQELCRRAGPAYTVVWTTCPDVLSAPPYWPWTQVIGEVRGQRRVGSELAGLVLDDPDGASRFDLYDATAVEIADAAERSPLLIVLDDLHLADEATLQLTRFVARQLRQHALMIVATVRTGTGAVPLPDDHQRELERAGSVLKLGGLNTDAVQRLVAGRVDATSAHALTGGNPLHLHHMLRELSSSPDGHQAGAEGTVFALQRSVERRVSAVSGPARTVLQAAAVLGVHFDLGDLAALVPEMDEGQVAVAVDVLAWEGLITLTENRGEFLHPLVHSAAHDSIGEQRVWEFHHRAALLRADDDETAAVTAHHLLLAGPAHRGEAVAACRVAAERASRSLAHRHAATLLARAIDSCDDDRVRLGVLLELGDAHWRAADHDAANGAYDLAWEAAVALGDPADLARAALRGGLEYYFVDDARPDVRSRVERALAAQSPGPSPLTARLLADAATHNLVSTADMGRRLATEAVTAARRFDDPVANASALIARQVADLGPATLHRRLADAHEILAFAREADDYRLEVHGRLLLMGALLEDGDVRALDAELRRQHEVVEEVNEPRFDRFALWLRTARSLLDGDAHAAEALAQRALDISVALDDPDALGVYGGQLGVARWMQGRVLEMESIFQEMRSAEPDQPLWSAVLAWMWATHGRSDAARGALDSIDLESVPSSMHWLLTHATYAEAAAAVGTEAQVEAAWVALLPYADRMVPIAMGAAVWGTAARPLALLALRRGAVADGLDLLRNAVRVCARLGAMPWLTQAQLDLADALAEHRSGDPDIDRLRSEAGATADHLGLDLFRERVKEVTPSIIDEAGPDARPAGGPVGPQVRVIGTFEVVGADGTVAQWRSRKARELLKILVSCRGAPMARETLMHLLWPDVDPAVLSNRLSVALSAVRRSLDPARSMPSGALVSTSFDAVALRLDRVSVDVENLLSEAPAIVADRQDPDAGARAFALLDDYRGQCFPDEPHAEWASALRSEVRMTVSSLASLVARGALADGDHLRAAEAYGRVLDVDPYDEGANLGLVAALRAVGAHGQADETYRVYEQRMRELGVPPSASP